MIARVLYRNNVQGVLNYVSGKSKSTVLGFQNTYSDTDTDTDMKFFGRVLCHLGNRHDSEKRYAHISLNLPRGEDLDDRDFFELSKNYMEHTGYGEQPYVVIRHRDTKHEHVHIVSSTIREDCLQINLSHDIRRSIATQKYLEKEFGLSPSPDTKQTNELPKYEMPEFQNRDINGVRFYIQDIMNIALQKYKVRSFKELALKKHHIEVKTVDRHGRIGVSYGVAVKDGYRSRFINGYTVHPQLSGPKLQKVFEQNQSSKLLPMVKKRLEKQLRTTYGLFKTINPEQLPDILESYQKLDCKVDYDEEGNPVDFAIYDKSGYVLKSDEMADDIGILLNPELLESDNTQMYAESGQLQLELQRCIKEAYKSTYQNSGRKIIFSEHIDRIPIRAIVTEMARSERFLFLKKYLHTDNRELGKLIQVQFDIVKDKLYISESVREEKQLNLKTELIK